MIGDNSDADDCYLVVAQVVAIDDVLLCGKKIARADFDFALINLIQACLRTSAQNVDFDGRIELRIAFNGLFDKRLKGRRTRNGDFGFFS